MERLRIDEDFFFPEYRSARGQYIAQAEAELTKLMDKSCLGHEMTGWFDWPRHSGFALAEKISGFVRNWDVHYDAIVVIGIGGSYLGTRAAAECLGHSFLASMPHSRSRRIPIFFAGHHLSESGLIELLDFLDGRQPIVNVISKSGTTTEPSVALRVIRAYIERRYGAGGLKSRIIATTDPTSGSLRAGALAMNWPTFDVPPDVGGRFSVLSAVGLLPLALAGYDIQKIIEGADELFLSLRTTGGGSQPHAVLRYAAARKYAWDAGKRIEILAYGEPKLNALVEWWKQLFGESEGKEGLGLFPTGLACTTDLHSLGQYVQDGCRNLVETYFIIENGMIAAGDGTERRLKVPDLDSARDGVEFLTGRYLADINHAAMMATKIAHYDGGVPSIELRMSAMDERCLGYLFAFFEAACGVSAAMLGVNPYDQPGVEAYKKNLFALMGKPGLEDLGVELRSRMRH